MSSLGLIANRDPGGSGGEGGEGKGEGGAGGCGGGCGGEEGEGGEGGEGGDGGISGGGGGDDTWLQMVTAGGEETAVTEVDCVNPMLIATITPARNKVASATVKLAKIFTISAVEDELAVLALSWRAPGSVACMLFVVIATSSGSGPLR